MASWEIFAAGFFVGLFVGQVTLAIVLALLRSDTYAGTAELPRVLSS